MLLPQALKPVNQTTQPAWPLSFSRSSAGNGVFVPMNLNVIVGTHGFFEAQGITGQGSWKLQTAQYPGNRPAFQVHSSHDETRRLSGPLKKGDWLRTHGCNYREKR